MKKFDKTLSGGDLRSIGKSNSVVRNINSQDDFDDLFKCLFHKDRIVVMRAVDAIEKITIINPSYLARHKKKILELCDQAVNKELMWHLALLVPRLRLTSREVEKVWGTLVKWTMDKTNSRIVRVNSLQGLFDLAKGKKDLIQCLNFTLSEVERENIPSLNARVRIMRKQLSSLVDE